MIDVSVVMSVYDQPEHVRVTVDSVLAQQGIEFEFIIVSDGASEEVHHVLNTYQDTRIKIVEQKNQGLTKALIKGCDLAQAPFIARIDAGDVMMKSRLAQQKEVLQTQSDVVIVSSWVRMQTEEGYFLYDVKLNECELNHGLKSSNEDEIKTPVHSSVMFRKSAYHQAGGYRPEFYFSQDCDLWARMINLGSLAVIQQPLTVNVFSPSGISGMYSHIQLKMKKLVALMNELRDQSKSEKEVLFEAEKLRPSNQMKKTHVKENKFSGFYFIAKILSNNKSPYAADYWQRALKEKPLSLKSWFMYLKFSLSRY